MSPQAALCRGTLLLALAALPLAAQERSILTLEDCIQAALKSPSAVSAARRQSEIASLGLARARAAFLPQTRANGAFTYNSSLAGAPDQPSYVALNGTREYLALLTAELELDSSGRLRAVRNRARADQDAATAGAKIAERDLRRSVAGAYYRAILARRLAQVARATLTEARAFEGRTRLLFERGEAARADVAKASAQAAFLEQAVTAADVEAEVANHQLASFWTSDVATPLPLLDVLDDAVPPPPDAPPLAPADSFLRRPEFSLLDAARRGFLAESAAARAERLPQTTVAFQYGVDSLRASFSDRGYAALFNVNVPLFEWSRARNAARQLELQAGQIEDARRRSERELSKEYQDALSRVRLGHAQIAVTRAQVTLSLEDLRLSRVRYDGGEGPALDVVTSQAQLGQARSNLYTALARYYESLADLAVASGK